MPPPNLSFPDSDAAKYSFPDAVTLTRCLRRSSAIRVGPYYGWIDQPKIIQNLGRLLGNQTETSRTLYLRVATFVGDQEETQDLPATCVQDKIGDLYKALLSCACKPN